MWGLFLFSLTGNMRVSMANFHSYLLFIALKSIHSLSSMYFEMRVEPALYRKSFAALTALERFFAAVYLFMNLQRSWLCKSWLALVALERFFNAVHNLMFSQFHRSNKSKDALAALIWLFFCVLPPNVNLQIRFLGAGEITTCAPVDLYPRMS